jgi:NTE family protein
MPTTQSSDKRVALVVGAGAVKCAAALGMWQVLNREGIEIDTLVGCSGGSLFATFMALDQDVNTCIDSIRRLWDRQVTRKRHWPSLLRAALPGLLGFDEQFGLIDDRVLLARLEEVFGDRTFASAKIPLSIVATDFRSGDQVVVSEGRLVDALRASMAIPYIWPPWPVGDRLLIDGSLANPMPVDVAIRGGADVILAIGFELSFPRRVKSVTRFAFQVNTIMTNNLFKTNFAFHNLAHHAEILLVLPNFDRTISLFDTEQFPYVIEQGERAMEAQVPYLHRLLATTSPELESE